MAAAMVCAVLPLLLSSVLGYVFYHKTIVQPFRDVLTQQHQVLLSLERIQADYWIVSEAVNDYVLTGDAVHRQAYEAAAVEVDARFQQLEAATRGDPVLEDPVRQARADWARVAADALGALTQPRAGVADAVPDIDRVLALEHDLPLAARQLEVVLDRMRIASEESHSRALRAFRHLEYAAVAAILLSMAMIGLGGYIVNRAIVLSADELVAGAKRFAAGRRDVPVIISVPPELAAVADAFNSMTRTIVEQQGQLTEYARRDGLTALLNRRAFDQALQDRMRLLGQGGPGFALLIGDVDHFKAINDRLGHPAGDDVLRQVAQALAVTARGTDAVFRYGGEEFALLLDGADRDTAVALAERMRLAVAELATGQGEQPRPITISFGLALCDAPVPLEHLIRAADDALYAAKAAGRNRLVVAG
jgi:diguanylate cyclase (GGDEF)-like protein